MRALLIPLLLVSLAPSAAEAGARKTSIRASRSLPEMEATAVWNAPQVEKGPDSLSVPLADGAILYSESILFKQLAGTLDAPIALDGATPLLVPAGTLFSAWLVNGQRQACSSQAQDAARPGKPAYQLCLVSRGGRQMDGAILRRLGERIETATPLPLKAAVTLKGEKGVTSASGRPWPLANLFTYRQSGGVGIITEYGDLLLAPQIRYERRIMVRKATADAVTLRCEMGSSDDLSRPLADQSLSTYKREEATLPWGGGAVMAQLCGGRVDIVRNGTMLDATVRAPFAPWWSFDAARGQFSIDGEAFAYGAQTR